MGDHGVVAGVLQKPKRGLRTGQANRNREYEVRITTFSSGIQYLHIVYKKEEIKWQKMQITEENNVDIDFGLISAVKFKRDY